MADSRPEPADVLLYTSIGLGFAAAALMAAFLIVRRNDVRHLPPSNRAERLIEECESRIAQIQRSVTEVQTQLGETNGNVPTLIR